MQATCFPYGNPARLIGDVGGITHGDDRGKVFLDIVAESENEG